MQILGLTFRNWIHVLDKNKESAYSTLTPPTSDHSFVQKVQWRFPLKERMSSPGSVTTYYLGTPTAPTLVPCPSLLTLTASYAHALTMHTNSYFLQLPHQYRSVSVSPLPEKLFPSSLHITVVSLAQDPALGSTLHKSSSIFQLKLIPLFFMFPWFKRIRTRRWRMRRGKEEGEEGGGGRGEKGGKGRRGRKWEGEERGALLWGILIQLAIGPNGWLLPFYPSKASHCFFLCLFCTWGWSLNSCWLKRMDEYYQQLAH